MIYLDSSAIVKLFRAEAETARLREFLAADDSVPLYTSQLAITEVKRALHAAGEPDLAKEAATSVPPLVLAPGFPILALPVTIEIIAVAGDLLSGSGLRSLDAIHVATARQAGDDLTGLVSYDARMNAVAARSKLPVVTPGD